MVFIHKIFFEKIYAYKTKFQTFQLPYKSALLRREHIYVNKECNFLNSQLSLQTILLLIPFNELPYASLRLHYSENHQESVDVCGVCGYVVENSKVWQYGLWSFQMGGTKLERFFPKNQHTQRKSLNFENWLTGRCQSTKI